MACKACNCCRGCRGPPLGSGRSAKSSPLSRPDLFSNRGFSPSGLDGIGGLSRGRASLSPRIGDSQRHHSLSGLFEDRESFLPADIGLNIKVREIRPSFLGKKRDKVPLFGPSGPVTMGISELYKRSRKKYSILPRGGKLSSPFFYPSDDGGSDDSSSDGSSSGGKGPFVPLTPFSPISVTKIPSSSSKPKCAWVRPGRKTSPPVSLGDPISRLPKTSSKAPGKGSNSRRRDSSPVEIKPKDFTATMGAGSCGNARKSCRCDQSPVEIKPKGFTGMMGAGSSSNARKSPHGDRSPVENNLADDLFMTGARLPGTRIPNTGHGSRRRDSSPVEIKPKDFLDMMGGQSPRNARSSCQRDQSPVEIKPEKKTRFGDEMNTPNQPLRQHTRPKIGRRIGPVAGDPILRRPKRSRRS